MTATATDARDQVFALILADVTAYDPGVELVWQGVPQMNQPTAQDTWARITMQHLTGGQASLAGVDGVRRWSRAGIITAQCFAPLASGSVQKATQLAGVIRDSLQGKATASRVWFTNPRIIEIGEDRDWYNVNAIIDFNYDELR